MYICWSLVNENKWKDLEGRNKYYFPEIKCILYSANMNSSNMLNI